MKRSLVYELQDELEHESRYLRLEEDEIKRLEHDFIHGVDPGGKSGKYIHLLDAVKDNIVTVKGKQFYHEGR